MFRPISLSPSRFLNTCATTEPPSPASTRRCGRGGTTYHYIPSKSHPYSLALRAVGPTLQKRLIALLRPAAGEETGYPAFFNRCSPSAMARLFRDTGFTNVSVSPFFRANDYFAFFTPAYVAVSLFENATHALGLRMFCSGFIVSAERPA